MSLHFTGMDVTDYEIRAHLSNGSTLSIGGSSDELITWSRNRATIREWNGARKTIMPNGSATITYSSQRDNPEGDSNNGSLAVVIICIVIALLVYNNPSASRRFINEVLTSSSSK